MPVHLCSITGNSLSGAYWRGILAVTRPRSSKNTADHPDGDQFTKVVRSMGGLLVSLSLAQESGAILRPRSDGEVVAFHFPGGR